MAFSLAGATGVGDAQTQADIAGIHDDLDLFEQLGRQAAKPAAVSARRQRARMSTAEVDRRAGQPEVRLDLWLWAARFFKTRALAKQAIVAGKVLLKQGAAKPSRIIHAGDTLDIVRGDERFEIVVVATCARRGAAREAAGLYRETEQSQNARAVAAERRRLDGTGYARPPTKPDKRARRLIRALGDIDAL